MAIPSIAALVAGFAGGAFLHQTDSGLDEALLAVLTPVATLWTRALTMSVLPLVLSQLLLAMLTMRQAGLVGRLSGSALAIFVALLTAAGFFALAVTPTLVHAIAPSAGSLPAHGLLPAEVVGQVAGQAGERHSFAGWFATLVPTNVVQAAADGALLPLTIAIVAFGLALARLDPSRVEIVRLLAATVSDAMLQLVAWILRLTPLAVFGLSLSAASKIGWGSAGGVVAFVVIVSLELLVFTVLLYPIAVLVGGVSLRGFARAVLPAQLVAVSTRSSLAALPALLDGARRHLQLPPGLTGIALPLATSTFKINRPISGAAKLLFLAHVFGIELTALQIATFMLTVFMLSFATAGLPGGGTAFKTLPAYLAAGIPIEGVILLETVDVIPDIFKTLANVTGDMTSTVLLQRVSASARVAFAEPEKAAALGQSRLEPSIT